MVTLFLLLIFVYDATQRSNAKSFLRPVKRIAQQGQMFP